MKKFSLLFLLLIFLLSGCTITYTNNLEDFTPSDGSETDNSTDSEKDDTSSDSDTNDDEENTQTSPEEVPTTPPYIPESPDIIEPITINSNDYFYPNTLTKSDPKIQEYSYIYDSLSTKYKIYSAYYSEYYDTLYIAYDNINKPMQTLKAKDLYQLERHALNYFTTDNNKTEYKEYLKAVLIYPDTLASSCRNGISDSNSLSINGCANYIGKEAVISLNRLYSINHFYEERKEYITSSTYYQIEPMRYTFAHEFGHVSTFYNMVYKNDENYEDYLKLRLKSYYSTIYPNGLPFAYSSQNSSYYTQPAEILADDYVELFYDTSKKAAEDTYEYILNEKYSRNSLKDHRSIQNLSDDEELYNKIKSYYTTNFLDYSNKIEYEKPIVISSPLDYIQYYESYSTIEDTGAKRRIDSRIDVNLIAVGEVNVNGTKYYRVILSNTFNTMSNVYDEKDTGKMMGYVKASIYSKNTNLKIYEINRNGNKEMTKRNMAPISDYNTIYVLPYFDFSYVVSLTNSTAYATMYDYLNKNISNQIYKIYIHSFGTAIN
jgi:hypothetical protein